MPTVLGMLSRMPIINLKNLQGWPIALASLLLLLGLASLGDLAAFQRGQIWPGQSLTTHTIPDQAMTIIDTVQTVCRLLTTQPSLTATEFANRLGTILTDQGGDLPIVVQPNDPAFQGAKIIRQVGTNRPANIRLVLADPSNLSVSMLQANLGNYSELPDQDLDQDPAVIFYVKLPAMQSSCAVIADIQPGKQGIADGIVTRLTIRRG